MEKQVEKYSRIGLKFLRKNNKIFLFFNISFLFFSYILFSYIILSKKCNNFYVFCNKISKIVTKTNVFVTNTSKNVTIYKNNYSDKNIFILKFILKQGGFNDFI
jgi:hypothetical protein